jgi:hypothetical protein
VPKVILNPDYRNRHWHNYCGHHGPATAAPWTDSMNQSFEELLMGPKREVEAIERADQMISRLGPDATIEGIV